MKVFVSGPGLGGVVHRERRGCVVSPSPRRRTPHSTHAMQGYLAHKEPRPPLRPP
ncbi:hypothetical protein T484DRAFT_1923672 [Baffinella frigidus]|nr:hypothetical protein T484DRAFT_1923672 [Cryptophyta sp. CCMP2293]